MTPENGKTKQNKKNCIRASITSWLSPSAITFIIIVSFRFTLFILLIVWIILNQKHQHCNLDYMLLFFWHILLEIVEH